MEEKLTLKFDSGTIEHLGISLYSKLPSVLSELVSNSWDADAKKVSIDFIDTDTTKEIHYFDDGYGMSFEDLNEKYLTIGRNRRADVKSAVTPSGRKVIGKKGLGKLSVFGVCQEVEITTIRSGVENRFRMNINDIRKVHSGTYHPEIMSLNALSDKVDGTTIIMRDIRRKSTFNVENIGINLAKKFTIFDDLNVILRRNGVNILELTNELKFKGFDIEFEWQFPDKAFAEGYDRWADVKGRVVTLRTPVKDADMRGIYLTSRGKIVNSADFYGLRDTDQFHSYITGYLAVDFIDEIDEDLISTDRSSLNWEHDVTRELQAYLQAVIRKIAGEWRKKRNDKKVDSLKSDSNVDVAAWMDRLPTYERDLARP